MSARAGYSWMRVVLRSLYAEWTREQAVAAIRTPDQLAALRAEIEANIDETGEPTAIPAGEYGDNLLLALLSLRVKFPESEGTEKLETNIAMRERRGFEPGSNRQ
jgi:hypothetical protein